MRKSLLIVFLFHISYSVFSQTLVSTYSGSGNPGFNNGTIDSATFNHPFGMSIDHNNNLLIADADNHCIRKINTATGAVTTIAGTGVAGWRDGSSDSAQFNSPSDLCVDDSGNVYVSDFLNQRIRKISFAGIVSTLAGSGIAGYIDGSPSIARFNYPRGICRDFAGNLYIGDSWNHRIRKIDLSGMISTYAGGGSAAGVGSVGALVDGNDTAARFYTPAGLAIDQHGNIFVADAYNHRIRKIDTSRIVTTYAGSGPAGNGNGGYMNGYTFAAVFNTPTELLVDTANNELYIGDTFNNRIRKIIISGDTVVTFAGNGSAAFTNGADTLAAFNYPRGIALSYASGQKVYVCDYNNHAIRLITSPNTTVFDLTDQIPDIRISPNPSENKFVVSSLGKLILELQIYDQKGIKMFESKNNQSMIQIDLSSNPKGIYFLKIKFDSGNVITIRLVRA